MFLLNIILLAVLVLASNAVEEGSLYFMSSPYPPRYTKIGIEGTELFANGQYETVEIHDTGALFYPNYGKYLTLNNNGQLILGDRPNRKLTVKRFVGGDEWDKGFYYKGNDTFQLSPDGTISFQSDRRSGREIQIMYGKNWRAEVRLRYGY